MGRYYDGDISGKFWFAVQSSYAPARFGGEEYEPNYINYYFGEEQLKEVKTELERIEEILGEDLKRLQHFFDNNNGYNEQMIIDWYKDHFNEKLDEHCVKELLVEYADYELGMKISNCIKENGECNINAEI